MFESPPRIPKQSSGHHEQINSIFSSLKRLGLPIEPRPLEWSPQLAANSLKERCMNLIQHLYYRDKDQLHSVIEQFKELAEILHSFTGHRKSDQENSFLLQKLLERLQEATTSIKTPRRRLFSPRSHVDGSPMISSLLNHQPQFLTNPASRLPNNPSTPSPATNKMTMLPADTRVTQNQSPPLFEIQYGGSPSDIRGGGDSSTRTTPPSLDRKGLAFETTHFAETEKSLVPYQIRNLPKDGLFMADHDDAFLNVSYRVRFECARLSLECRKPITDVLTKNHFDFGSYEDFWAHVSAKLNGKLGCLKGDSNLWDQATNTFEGISLKGSLSLNTGQRGAVFKCKLHPFKQELSCRFQRAFGSDRFLYLDAPILDESQFPSHLKGHMKNLQFQYQNWLSTEKRFLGRQWRVFMLREKKRSSENKTTEIILFATDGEDLRKQGREVVLIEEFIRWFVPLENCMTKGFCKIFSRLELGLSKSRPIFEFQQNQIESAKDKFPTNDPESPEFRDLNLDWTEFDDICNCGAASDLKVMDDGCSEMSHKAGVLISKNLGLAGVLPSVFQGRIAGAKGLWLVSDEGQEDVWIKLGDSQRKFDIPAHVQDQHHRTFDVLRWSRPLSTATLHQASLPILEDRGVPEKSLEELVQAGLNYEGTAIKNAWDNSELLLKWLHDQDSQANSDSGAHKMLQTGSMPHTNLEKLKFALGSGFSPNSSKYVGALLKRVVDAWSNRMIDKMKTRVGRSTTAFAIADPKGVLKPGEVHLGFSNSFVDEGSGFCAPFLDNIEVLLTRQPSFRNSDIQKVRAVYKSELAYIKDVLVFPSRGRFPLAETMQNGDYDGDRFWICWEPTMVEPFRNAPPPVLLQTPGELGISTESTTIGEIFSDPHKGMEWFLQKSLNFRSRDSMLGKCSNFHKRLAYLRNSLSSPDILKLATLREYLLDAPKNGYCFTEQDWKVFKHSIGFGNGKELPKTAYEEASSDARIQIQPNKYHIVDYIKFWVIKPWYERLTKDLSERIKNLPTEDSQVSQLWDDMWKEKDHAEPSIKQELISLSTTLDRIRDNNCKMLATPNKPSMNRQNEKDAFFSTYANSVKKSYAEFCSISPLNPDSPIVRQWLLKPAPYAPSTWELLKASALYAKFHGTSRPSFVFELAGQEICYLKACNTEKPRMMVPQILNQMVPRKRMKAPSGEVEGDDEISESESDTAVDAGRVELEVI